MDADKAVQKDSIRSESCLVRYFVLINIVLAAVMLILIYVLAPVSDKLQKKEDRKKAEDNYDRYYSDVVNYIEETIDEYHSKNKDGTVKDMSEIEKVLTIFLLNKPDNPEYYEEIEYVRDKVYSHYSKWSDVEPEKIIGIGIINGKSRDDIIEDLIDDINDNRWFGRLEYDNPAADITFCAALIVALIILGFFPALAAVIIVKKCRYVIVEGGTVFLSSKNSTALSDVIRAETGFLKKVTVITNNRRYKRRFIRNNCEIVKFINEHCNNAAQ